MKLRLFYLSLIFSTISIFAQIDSTIWYPLAAGNTWFYRYGMMDPLEYTVSVIGDTIMPNGKTYWIFDEFGNKKYQRVENNKYAYYYNRADSLEYLLYDFASPDKTIWPENTFEGLDYGIDTTLYRYNSYFQKIVPIKIFDWVLIDSSSTPPDTIWGALLDVWPTKITKGIGVTNDGNDHGGLYAAIINGDTIGTLTSVDESNIKITDYELAQNYPNPFNPSTIISFKIPMPPRPSSYQGEGEKEGLFVSLVIYDILGEKIATLVNENKKPGTYELEFNSAGLPSGIYFYRLTAGDFSDTKKMVLLR